MPAYNAGRFIEAAIRSLLVERGAVDLDIVVVDDGSTDDTRQIVAQIAGGFDEVRLLQNPRKGIAAARNTGIENARNEGGFIAFLDADDLSYPGRIQRQQSILTADPAIDVLYGLVEMFTDSNETDTAPAAGTVTKIIRGPYLQSAMYRPHVMRDVGQFDESFRQGCDTDYVLRVVEREFNVVLDSGIAAYYRRHDANVTLNVDEMQREFMLASLKWAVRNRIKGKPSLPGVFAELFLRRDEIEKGGEA
ncbi:MAG: glycosyltransferase family A protein [Hyphomicrobiales bacterium]|nr:glycosyltransferase family A protein [Hyphomicrobiales bacterium]